jgi:hypothetical protein
MVWAQNNKIITRRTNVVRTKVFPAKVKIGVLFKKVLARQRRLCLNVSFASKNLVSWRHDIQHNDT